MCYGSWLRKKVFSSQEEIARTLRRSPAQVSRYLKIAGLPAVVVGAFDTPNDICEAWGVDLADMWADLHRRDALARASRAIAAMPSRPPAREIYRRLLASATQRRAASQVARDEVVKDSEGMPLFRIGMRTRWVCLMIPGDLASADILAELRSDVTRVLECARGEHPAPRRRSRAVSSDRSMAGFGTSAGCPRLSQEPS